jgi:hypothetical protein
MLHGRKDKHGKELRRKSFGNTKIDWEFGYWATHI